LPQEERISAGEDSASTTVGHGCDVPPPRVPKDRTWVELVDHPALLDWKSGTLHTTAPSGTAAVLPHARIRLLGVMGAINDLGENILPYGKKARALFGYLCLNMGRPVARSRIQALLWDRMDERHARANLRQTLRVLREAMRKPTERLIQADTDTIRLEIRLCWIDAFEILVSGEPAPDPLSGDFAWLRTRDLLEDMNGVSSAFDEWLLAQRSRFHEQLILMFEKELQQADGADPAWRAASARRVISFDPTHEGASRILMRALADLGERGQAIREYQRCRAALKSCLDVEPSKQTRALCEALRVHFDAGSTSRHSA
jgi:DNA-binding SARP family transcriptional activator